MYITSTLSCIFILKGAYLFVSIKSTLLKAYQDKAIKHWFVNIIMPPAHNTKFNASYVVALYIARSKY